MSPFQIRCFKKDAVVPANAFFILSKGKNTGRPSLKPYTNSFVFSCADSKDVQPYYWLLYALWAGNRVVPLLRGSVIAFIRLDDLKQLVAKTSVLLKNWDAIEGAIKQIIKLENQLEQQRLLVRQAKIAVIRDLVR